MRRWGLLVARLADAPASRSEQQRARRDAADDRDQCLRGTRHDQGKTRDTACGDRAAEPVTDGFVSYPGERNEVDSDHEGDPGHSRLRGIERAVEERQTGRQRDLVRYDEPVSASETPRFASVRRGHVRGTPRSAIPNRSFPNRRGDGPRIATP